MLNLISLFEEIGSENFCIVKISEAFPEYSPGEDIDIFCYDVEKLARKIVEWGTRHLRRGLKVKIKVDSEHNHTYVDLIEDFSIHLRFDLYGRLPAYKKLLIKPALFESIVEHRVSVARRHNGTDLMVPVPQPIDEMILRYIEFVEWYNTRPDKIKHLDYILENIGEEQRHRFFEKLHHYTAIPAYSQEDIRHRGILRRTLSRLFSTNNS